MFKTLLDSLGTIMGVFGNLNFFIFLKTFRRLDPPWNTGQNNFRKNYPNTCSKHVWTFWEGFWGFLEFWKILIFWDHFEDSTLHGTLGKKNFSKSTPKHFQSTFGQFGSNFGRFWNFESFLIFWKHFEDSTIHGKLGQKIFRKNYPKTCSKHVWTILGTTLGFFAILKIFDFLRTFRRLDPPSNTGQKYFIENINPKHVQNTFGHFWERFRDFCNFEKNWFFENISKTRAYMEHWAKKLFEKYSKLRSKYFWTIWERFWAFLEIWKFFDFFKIFSKSRPSMQHWAKKIIWKNYPKTCSKLVWHFWEHFWLFLEFWKIFDFWKHFEDSTLHGTLGKIIFWKNYPNTCSKHVWTFGKDFGHFWNFENF